MTRSISSSQTDSLVLSRDNALVDRGEGGIILAAYDPLFHSHPLIAKKERGKCKKSNVIYSVLVKSLYDFSLYFLKFIVTIYNS